MSRCIWTYTWVHIENRTATQCTHFQELIPGFSFSYGWNFGLIRRMSQANPLWGAPRIHGELLKLGIAVAQSTVTQYLPRRRKPPSQTWPSRRAGGAPGSEWLRHSGERGRSWNGTPSSLPGESRSGPQRIQDHRTVLARSRPMTGCHTHNSESERRKPL